MSREDLERSLTVGDLDELIREVDRRCDAGDWDGVDEVRRRARAAIERGHQLWPAASWAAYRLALDAPAAHAAPVVDGDAGWMAPGPLAEVVAQRHDWAELGGVLEPGALRATVAQERVVRGDRVPDDEAGELPGELLDWEPDYALAEYGEQGGRFPPPDLREPTATIDLQEPTATIDLQEPTATIDLQEPTATIDLQEPTATIAVGPDDGADTPGGPPAEPDPDAVAGLDALVGAVGHWASRSGGTVRASGVRGDHLAALAALGLTEVRSRPATLAEAGSLLAWAAADGALHGRRRGAAAGRLELWWVLACLCGTEDDWPVDPGPHAAELRFGLWLPTGSFPGWSCRLWVEDPLDGLSWALDAYEPSQAPGAPNTLSV